MNKSSRPPEFAFYMEDAMYVWNPKSDITVHELALLMPAFTSFYYIPESDRCKAFMNWKKSLPINASRHLEKRNYEQKQ